MTLLTHPFLFIFSLFREFLHTDIRKVVAAEAFLSLASSHLASSAEGKHSLGYFYVAGSFKCNFSDSSTKVLKYANCFCVLSDNFT